LSLAILINCRDRLEPLVALLGYLERAGQDQIYLLDNDSAYPPLLDYFASSPHRVVRLGHNVGRLAPWDANLFAEFNITGRFVFSDPDVVPDPECPLDAIEYFGEILDRYPDRDKAGFGLRIDDLPDVYRFKHEVVVWESQFWERQLAPRIYDAPIDTTFALYRSPRPHRFDRSIRTGHPYVARHVPWYLDDRSLPDDEVFYRERAEGDDVNYWGRHALPFNLANAIASRESLESPFEEKPRLGLGVPTSLDRDGLLAASGWRGEPEPQDEALNTPWAELGWHSWNDMSPEVELCELIVALVVAVRPKQLIETGTGQGFLTRRIAAVLRHDDRLMCFESDPTWREALRTLSFFDQPQCDLSPSASPQDNEFAAAGLCCLDSDVSFRLSEIERWWQSSAEGAVLFVHDAGNGHGPETLHAQVREKITELHIPGIFLANPRGAFIGVKASRYEQAQVNSELASRNAAVENELRAVLSTRTFRYSYPARRLYRRLKDLLAE
jgi:hypothetical protein